MTYRTELMLNKTHKNAEQSRLKYSEVPSVLVLIEISP